ncbi:hypothetical protein Bca101_024365 [Brassica carinata]
MIYYAKILTNKYNSLEEDKKEETRGHNVQIHVVVSVGGVDAAVADVAGAAATSSRSRKDDQMGKPMWQLLRPLRMLGLCRLLELLELRESIRPRLPPLPLMFCTSRDIMILTAVLRNGK